jgi:hypothetical protein
VVGARLVFHLTAIHRFKISTIRRVICNATFTWAGNLRLKPDILLGRRFKPSEIQAQPRGMTLAKSSIRQMADS